MEAGGAELPGSGPRSGLWLGLALSVLGALPFLVVRLPQLTDYPSHLARYRIMLDGGHDPWLARYYQFDWIFTGNLGADMAMLPLGRLLGVETAGWLLGLLIAVLGGLGVVAVAWTLRRRIDFAVILALATLWSPAMAMGFYNFCLSLALALLAFALWVRMDGSRWRAALFVPIGLVVWLFHASGWGVLGVLVFGYEWSRGRNWRAFLRPWSLFFPILPQLLAPAARGSLQFGDHVVTYKIAIWLRALRGFSMMLDIGLLLTVLLVLMAALILRRIDGRVGWAALILAVLTLVMPRHLGGGDFADYRLIAVTLTIACLAIDWPGARGLTVLALALFVARVGDTAMGWRVSEQRTLDAIAALDHLPQGARVASAVLIDRDGWDIDPLEHVGSYATVRRGALVNSHFAISGIHMLHLREGSAGFTDPSQRVFHSPGERIDLSMFPPAREADWLWYVGDREPDLLPPGARVVWRGRDSLLARLAKPDEHR